MKKRIESFVQDSFRKVGIDIRYVDENNPGLYNNCLLGAVSVKQPVNIIQIGANDGKYNDPIFDFVKEHKDYTNIVLVEPLEEIIPHLESNYAGHPSSEIFNKAVSWDDSSEVKLYRIKRKYWSEIDVGYGKDWPDYRVPTGVTTTDKSQLVQWVSKNIQPDLNPNQIIESYDVSAIRPKSILSKSGLVNSVDLLQVDAEGIDDKIVYSFFEDEIYPNMINIEIKHLDTQSKKVYSEKLSNEGYRLYEYSRSDKLAIRL